MNDNITLLLSLDNYVYGVLTTALDLFPFNLIKSMIVDATYLYGIKTYCVFANSKNIEDLIVLTANSVLKPLFFKDDTSGNVITTRNQTYKKNLDCYINTSKVSITTQNILQQCDKILNFTFDDKFLSFCNDFLQDCETLKLIEKTFEDIQDADMMIQCDNLLSDYVEEMIID